MLSHSHLSHQMDWSRLQHAYGPALDVPDQLASLGSNDEQTRAQAYRLCYSNIFHQGTRYSASVAAIPLLFDMLLAETTPARGDIVELLLHLAVGYPQYHESRGFDFTNRRPPTGGKASNAGKCYKAVEGRVVDLEQLLTDQRDDVRMHAAHALAFFRPPSDNALEKLEAMVAADDSLASRGTAAVSLGVLTRSRYKNKQQPNVESILAQISAEPQEPALVGFMASIGLAHLQQSRFSAESTRLLLSRLNEIPSGCSTPWMCDDKPCLAASVLYSLARRLNSVAYDAIHKLATETRGENAADVASYLFALLFPKPISGAKDLTADQRNALRIALNNPDLWCQGISRGTPCDWAPEFLRSLGFGATKQEVETWVAGSKS